MPTYEATVDAEGRLVLPREIADKVGARPGDRLGVVELGHGSGETATGLSLRVFAARAPVRGPEAPAGADLGALKAVTRLARRDGARTSAARDPIGDFLLEEDLRSRGR